MRKLTITRILIATAIVVVTGGGMYGYWYYAHHRSVNSSQVYTGSIHKAANWLYGNNIKVQSNQWLLIDYLERKYAFDQRFSTEQIKQFIGKEPVGDDEWSVYKRIIDPSTVIVSPQLSDKSPLDKMSLQAMQCDRLSLNADFTELIDQNIKLGGYNLTHAAFVLQRLNENGCSAQLNPITLRTSKDQIIAKMKTLLTQTGNNQDLRYEAAVFLLDLGVKDAVPLAFMQQLVAGQLPDGDWPAVANSTVSDDHTTMLALWALLAYTQPNPKIEPMIHRSDSTKLQQFQSAVPNTSPLSSTITVKTGTSL